MAYRASHGGGCCGINHIRNFSPAPWNRGGIPTREELRAMMRQGNTAANRGMLLEVVLTNKQCRQHPNLPVMLQEEGFKLVNRFLNPNSGNICNVFHYNKSPRSLTSRLPFPLVEAIER
jgi:hypothetical protein